MDIIKDPEFVGANAVYQTESAQLNREKREKRDRLSTNQRSTTINIKQLYESGLFSLTRPDTLQNKVFFELMLFFCRRGRQNLRELKKVDFSIGTDSSGTKYGNKAKDELTKNRREKDEAQEKPVCVYAQFCHLRNIFLI